MDEIKPVYKNAKKGIKVEDIVKALMESKGRVYIAAKMLGCSNDTIYRRSKKTKAIKDAMDKARGELLDEIEGGLFSSALKNEPWAVVFALKTIGKSRGYIERSELTGADGGPIKVAIGPDLSEFSDDKLSKYFNKILQAANGLADRTIVVRDDRKDEEDGRE
jgi:hypothetical protein